MRIVVLWGYEVGHLTHKRGTFLSSLRCFYCKKAAALLLMLRSTAGFFPPPCCQLMLMMPSPQSALCTLTASPQMDSKQLVSARLTLSYHNLIILMILFLNLRCCTCIHPEGSHGWTHCMNLTWGLGNVQGWLHRVVCLPMCVCDCATLHRQTPLSSSDCSRLTWRSRLQKTIRIKQPSALSVKHQSQRGLDCGVSSPPIELSGLI